MRDKPVGGAKTTVHDYSTQGVRLVPLLPIVQTDKSKKPAGHSAQTAAVAAVTIVQQPTPPPPSSLSKKTAQSLRSSNYPKPKARPTPSPLTAQPASKRPPPSEEDRTLLRLLKQPSSPPDTSSSSATSSPKPPLSQLNSRRPRSRSFIKPQPPATTTVDPEASDGKSESKPEPAAGPLISNPEQAVLGSFDEQPAVSASELPPQVSPPQILSREKSKFRCHQLSHNCCCNLIAVIIAVVACTLFAAYSQTDH